MRIAVAGATGNIGKLTVAALTEAGHDVVGISRSQGVDLTTGTGLEAALAGVDAVIDATNAPATDAESTVAYFGGTTANLLAAEERAGVRHHVLLSIAGVSRVEGNAHYSGKREQERLVEAGPIPFTIVPATQFHDFAEMVVGWVEQDGVAAIPPLLLQPIALADVAAVLAEVALGAPQGRHVDVAGPDPQDMVDMARRTLAVRGRTVRLVPTWDGPMFGAALAGNVLLPEKDAQLAPTSFDAWLEQERAAGTE